MGLYAYKKKILEQLTNLAPSENEKVLKLEQYRAIDNGIPIKVILTGRFSKGIDTIDDLKLFERA